MACFPTGNGDLSNKHSWLVVELTYPSEKYEKYECGGWD
jgi:hypothetical protein